MAKTVFSVDHECGHTQEHDLSTKPAGKRAGLASWLAGKPCRECGRSSGISPEEKARQEQATAQTEDQLGLPELEATQRQRPKVLPWARQVRADLMREAYALVEEGKETEDWFHTAILDPARVITRCGWWLDNREASVTELPELLADSGEENPHTWTPSQAAS